MTNHAENAAQRAGKVHDALYKAVAEQFGVNEAELHDDIPLKKLGTGWRKFDDLSLTELHINFENAYNSDRTDRVVELFLAEEENYYTETLGDLEHVFLVCRVL